MPRGTRPSAALVASVVVLSGALAACGSSDTPGTGLAFADRLDAVTVSGDVGDATIEFTDRMTADEVEAETLVEGDGDALADEDRVFVNYVVGNGFTRKTAIDSFGEDAPALALTVGAPEDPEAQTLDTVLANVLGKQIKAGLTKGSRIVMTGSTEAFFGAASLSPALATAGIGNADGLVIVADVEDVEPLDGPTGTAGTNPRWAPKLVFGGKGPTGFDFAGITKPADKAELLSTNLKTGPGAKVAKGDLLVLDYLGAIYGGAKPFDESYSKEPITAPAGGFVEGFNEALEGQTVGSRIVVRIPPAKGYADQAQGETIPANSTLYFVVDILAAV